MAENQLVRCGVKHKHAGVVCVRPKDHDGLCWGKSIRGKDGTINFVEWVSRDDGFHYHVGYGCIYPPNAVKG